MTAALSYGSGYQIFTAGSPIPGTASRCSFLPAFMNDVLDAAAEKTAMIGAVVWKDRGTHTMSSAGAKIHFFLGTTVFANVGTALDIGIQDVGAAKDADGTFDVKATLVPGTETLTSSVINTATMETGTKSIATGDTVAVVFDMTARAGSDSVTPTVYTSTGGLGNTHPYCRHSSSVPTWGVLDALPNVLLEADDGTKGWILHGVFKPNLMPTTSYNSGSSPDEYGSRIKLPMPVTLEAVTLPVSVAAVTSDFELCVYSDITGTPTLVGSAVTFNADQIGYINGDRWLTVYLTGGRALSAATVYGITARPTTVGNILIEYFNYGAGNNAKMAALAMGVESHLINRLNNTGAFTLDDTQHVPMILHVSNFDDGAGGGSSGGIKLVGRGGLAG